MVGYVVGGVALAGGGYLVYRALKNRKPAPAGSPNGGSIASRGRQANTQAIPQGNDRTTLANNAIGAGAALATGALASTNPNFKPTGTAPSNPGATGSQVTGASNEAAGIAAGAAVAGALAPAGISALQKAFTTTPTPTAVVDPLSHNADLSQQGTVGQPALTSKDWAYIDNPSNDASTDLSAADFRYINDPANDAVANGGSVYSTPDELAAIDSGYQSDYTGEPAFETPDSTFSDF